MSDDVVIRVDNLSKQYRIGGARADYKTIRETIVDAVKAPFLRAQEALSTAHGALSRKRSSALSAPGSKLSSPTTLFGLSKTSLLK